MCANEVEKTIIHIEDFLLNEPPSKKFNPKEYVSPPEKFFSNKPSIYASYPKNVLGLGRNSAFHSFVAAWKHHLPLVISPDMIWLLIVQGFARYVDYNIEELRKSFVTFEGMKELKVFCNFESPEDATEEDWKKLFSEFNDLIGDNVGKDLLSTITPNFSTTTQEYITVCQITTMAVFRKLFKYVGCLCTCGIPYVILEGTLKDWENVREKFNSLMKHVETEPMKRWAENLNPILDEFVNSKKGIVNLEFWKQTVQIRDSNRSYNQYFYKGWFLSLFPYDSDCVLNLGQHRDVLIGSAEELLMCPLTLVKFSNPRIKYNLQLNCGFIGISQDPKTKALRPEIGWFVAH